MRQIGVRVLAPFEVIVDGAPVSGLAYTKVRALLAYLAVEPQRPHSRAALAALLWPEQSEANARGSLSQALTTLRNALGDKHAPEPLLLADAQTVRLNPDCALEVDATAFRAALRAAEAHAHRSWRTCALCAARLRQALALYQGGFLADLSVPDSAGFEEWAAAQRTQLLQAALSGLERLAERAIWRGATAEALADARRLVALDPLLEQSQRTLMRLLAWSGDPAAAKAQYRQLQTTLLEEPGTEPEPATTALSEQIRHGALAPLAVAPPLAAAPLPPTPLVGRVQALEAITTALRGEGRLLSILGAGGIGKTRLALEAAHALRYDFEDGVALVELAALTGAEQVATAIARALGVKEQPRRPLAATLCEALHPRHLLLILDNFEHVVEAAALVADLLAACPGLSVLATSRAPLLIRMEQQLNVEPLADDEAVQLFLQRARAAGASPDAGEAAATVYAAICRRLDRLPLAIELIAVRARDHAPGELLRQIEQPLETVVGTPSDLAPRHHSLRRVIQWSYDLLDAREQRVFRALGAFAGGCTPEAAQAVVGPGLAAMPLLEALHRASLVQRQVVAGQTRFLPLETIREFARELLTLHDEAAAARQRHAEQFARFAMAAYDELLRAEAARWHAWVAAEQGNLELAFRWAEAHQQHELMLRLATGVWRFHYKAGSLHDALARLETALAHREQVPLELQVHALKAAGSLAGALNDYARVGQWMEAAVAAGWALGDQDALQMVMNNFGFSLLEQGELEAARVYLEVSLSLARRAADPSVAKFPLGLLAGLHYRLGEHRLARTLSEEGLRLNRARRDPEGTADALRTLALITLAQGDQEQARALADEALAAHQALGHLPGMGQDLALLGDIARAACDHTAALALYQQSLELWRGRENLVRGALVIESVAQTLSELGEPLRAATLFAAAAAIRQQAGARLTIGEQAARDQTIAACRAALGQPAFAEAWETGSTLTLTRAVTLALEPLAATICR